MVTGIRKIGIIAILLLFGIGPAGAVLTLAQAKDRHEDSLLAIDGVRGIYSRPETAEIVVMVEKADAGKGIPDRLDGFIVSIDETGRIYALVLDTAVSGALPAMAVSYSRTGSERPVFGGISVGNAHYPNSSRTLGLVVSGSQRSGKAQYVLSCAHVLAMNSQANPVPTGINIWQPGGYDGLAIPHRIGSLSKYIPIRFYGATNYANAAIGSLAVAGKPYQVLDATNNNFYVISGTTDVRVGDAVRKSGRTTGVTTSTVLVTNASVKVCYSAQKWAVFKDQIVTGAFSADGDSGSAADKNGRVVGLLYAGSETVDIVCKSKYIIEPLGIRI